MYSVNNTHIVIVYETNSQKKTTRLLWKCM